MTISSEFLGPTMIWVSEVGVIGPHRLSIIFSDGSAGTRDFSEIKGRSGSKVAPLADPDYFARVFIEDGVLTWPNGYDWDAMSLHADMAASGGLRRPQAAE